MNLNILVTGGAGYIGSALVKRLLDDGHRVRCLDRRAGEVPQLVGLEPAQLANFTPIVGDVRDRACVEHAMEAADCIFHLASVVGYPACAADPKEAHSINIDGTQAVVELTPAAAPLIFLSTCSIYGRLLDDVCHEASAVRPLTVYGQTKAAAEGIVLEAGGVALRPVTAFGRSYRVRADLLAHTLIRAGMANEHLKLFEPEAIRPFIHVDDLVDALRFSQQNISSMRGKAYNVGSKGGTLTKLELAKKVAALTGLTFEIDETATDPDNRSYYVSFDRIERLGFRTRLSFDAALADTVNWLRLFHE